MALNNKMSDFADLKQGLEQAKAQSSQQQPQAQFEQPPVEPVMGEQHAPQWAPRQDLPSPDLVGRGFNLNGNRSIPYNLMEDKLTSFLTAYKETANQFAGLTREKTWEILSFDGKTNGALASAILFCRFTADVVAVYPLLLQASLTEGRLEDKVIQRPGGVQLTVPQVAEELLTSEKWTSDAITNYVRSQYPTRSKVYVVGGRVIPTEVEPSNLEQIKRTIFYANDALEYFLSDPTKGDRFSIVQKRPTERLVIHHDFNPGMGATGVGMPVRTDLAVRLSVRDTNAGNALGARRSASLSTVRMYMTLMYEGANTMQPQMPYGFQAGFPQLPPMFQPYAVIDSLDNEFAAATLESQLLALSTVPSILTNNNWYKIFKPNYSITKMGEDSKDIGAITQDVNFPDAEGKVQLGYTATKTQDFDLFGFLRAYLKDSIIFQMDVPELGDLTFIQRTFLEATGLTGKADVTEKANRRIIDAANYLTNGAFSEMWNPNDPIVQNQMGRIEQGYYIDANGQMRDLAEIDYIWLLNRASVEDARQFMESWNPNSGDEITRFCVRQNIYNAWLSGSYHITGYAQRLTINPMFLQVLGMALAKVGGEAQLETVFMDNNSVERGYRNQVLGMGMNQINGMYSMYGAQPGNAGMNTVWRQYQTSPLDYYYR